MTWGKMDDKFHRNRKVRALRQKPAGREALGTWVYWWSWVLDDPELNGFVPAVELSAADAQAAPLLVEVGLWDVVEDGYVFHDFHAYNPTKEQVETKRAADRERKTPGAKAPKEPETDPGRNGFRAESDPESKPSSKGIASPARVPSRPLPDPEGERADAPPLGPGQTREPNSGEIQTFEATFGAEAFRRGIRPTPTLTHGQQRSFAKRAVQLAKDGSGDFELEAKALVRQAFDDAEATGSKLVFALGEAIPGKPKLARASPNGGMSDAEREKRHPTTRLDQASFK